MHAENPENFAAQARKYFLGVLRSQILQCVSTGADRQITFGWPRSVEMLPSLNEDLSAPRRSHLIRPI
jgi:hypothetical protein|eukprot:COSAG01_NODE_6790_length_3496_cov_3.344127_6_plen_68_part_00